MAGQGFGPLVPEEDPDAPMDLDEFMRLHEDVMDGRRAPEPWMEELGAYPCRCTCADTDDTCDCGCECTQCSLEAIVLGCGGCGECDDCDPEPDDEHHRAHPRKEDKAWKKRGDEDKGIQWMRKNAHRPEKEINHVTTGGRTAGPRPDGLRQL